MSNEMKTQLETLVGKEVASVEVFKSYDGWECGFTMHFTDGTKMEVGSRGFNEGGSIVEVDVI